MKTCSIRFLVIYVDVADGILLIKDLVSYGAAKAINNSWAVIITKLIWKFGFYIFIMQNTVHPEKLAKPAYSSNQISRKKVFLYP